MGDVCWGLDPSHLVVGYQDVNLYGIRSCTVLKEYNVSLGGDFVTKLLANEGRLYVITTSGLIKIFSYNTQEELISTNLRQAVLNVSVVYQSRGMSPISSLIIATAHKIYQLSRHGEE